MISVRDWLPWKTDTGAAMSCRTRSGGVSALASVFVVASLLLTRADAAAYLVNVTVQPAYNFGTTEAAVAYGHGVGNKITGRQSYAQLVGDFQADFNTYAYKASYRIVQATNELCRAQIWQMRRSATPCLQEAPP